MKEKKYSGFKSMFVQYWDHLQHFSDLKLHDCIC